MTGRVLAAFTAVFGDMEDTVEVVVVERGCCDRVPRVRDKIRRAVHT